MKIYPYFKTQAVIYGFIILVFSVLLIYIVISYSNYNRILQKNIKIQQIYELKKQQSHNFLIYQQQMLIVNKHLAIWHNYIITKKLVADLLAVILTIGKKCGINFAVFSQKQESIDKFFIAIPIDIIVTGNYYQLKLFLQNIAVLKKMITIGDFNITSVFHTKNHNLLKMHILINIYTYKYKTHDQTKIIITPNLSHINMVIHKHDIFNPQNQNKKQNLLLSAVKFVGVLKQQMLTWGLIQIADATQKIIKVEFGEYIPNTNFKIVSINEQFIELEELITTAHQKIKSHKIKIYLRSKME